MTREKVDPTLDRVEDLVEDTYLKVQGAITSAESAGKKASEGAVKGFFTGIVKLPFELVGTLASPILKSIDKDVAKQLTEKDVELMARAGDELADSGKIDRAQRWENPASGNSGTITIIRKYQAQDTECVEARITISNRRKQILNELNNYCLNAEKKWVIAADLDK